MILPLILPGFKGPINSTDFAPNFNLNLITLGGLLSAFLNIVFYIAIFMAFYWLILSSFQYIMASGNKESLAKARERIKWTLIGLVVIFAAYFIAKFGSELLPPVKGGFLPF